MTLKEQYIEALNIEQSVLLLYKATLENRLEAEQQYLKNEHGKEIVDGVVREKGSR